MSDPEFPAWRMALSTVIGVAMFITFFGMCLFATQSWFIAAAFGVVTLLAHFALTHRRRT
jgi:hypothetical protein